MSCSATQSRRRPTIRGATRMQRCSCMLFLRPVQLRQTKFCACAAVAKVTAISSSVTDATAAGDEGVMFDVEEIQGSSGTMVPAFAKPFAPVKHVGFRVAVTTSHSAPYQCDTPEDAAALVKARAVPSVTSRS